MLTSDKLKSERTHWHDDDEHLEREYADVLEFVRKNQSRQPGPGRGLDRQVRSLAAQTVEPAWKDAWILGQGPLLVLVTCILFAIAMLILIIQ